MGNNIREAQQHEDIATRALYEAALAGSVPSLKRLIQKDPLILNKLSLTHLSETPLHISALLGHLDFTKALLTHHSRLATLKDSFRRTPLLLASAEGHKETVQALLKAYPDACLVRDQDGKIALHYAAMRGHVEVLAELMRAKPESVTFRVLDRGDMVFHLCVTYNQLECLNLLVEEAGDDEDILNARAGCDGGLTILELAVMLRRIETIKYLLSVPSIRAEGDDEVHGKVLNMLENSPRDFLTLEIQRVFMDAGIMRIESKDNEQLPLQNNKSKKDGKERKKRSKKVKEKRSKAGNWVEEKRGMLMVVATMMTTMTFQATINPPGGFWSEMNTDMTFNGVHVCNVTNPCVAGTAVSSYMNPVDFNSFQNFNIVCFLFSTSITLLLVCGFPLRKRLLVWLMSIGMSLTLIFLTLTFNEGAHLVIPKIANHEDTTTNMIIGGFTLFWLALFGLVALIHTIRLLNWLVKKFWRRIHPKNMTKANNNAKPLQLIPINSHEKISSYV